MKRLSRLGRPAARWAVALKSATLFVLAAPGMVISPAASAHTTGLMTDPVSAWLDTQPTEKAEAVHCLSQAIYYEAGFEPLDGQKAVAQVVLNRVADAYYPDTICGVVFQGAERKTGCQFSFACDGSLTRRPPTDAQYRRAQKIATEVIEGRTVQGMEKATHYHTDYVSPAWAPRLDEVTTIGTHIFYSRPDGLRPYKAPRPYQGGEVNDRIRVAVLGV